MGGMKAYCPERGDLVWIDFTPTRGHEQKGRRPALVLSPREYNIIVGNMVCCPASTRVKAYRFEVPVTVSGKQGVIQADQIRTFDWRSRKISFIEKIDPRSLEHVQELVKVLITG